MTTAHLPPLPTSPTAPTTVLETTLTLVRPPEDVFPLLCPVLEYLWIPDWSCTMVHSHSGVAELGCAFLREQGETWLTTRYEPPVNDGRKRTPWRRVKVDPLKRPRFFAAPKRVAALG